MEYMPYIIIAGITFLMWVIQMFFNMDEKASGARCIGFTVISLVLYMAHLNELNQLELEKEKAANIARDAEEIAARYKTEREQEEREVERVKEGERKRSVEYTLQKLRRERGN